MLRFLLVIWSNNDKRVRLVQSGPHHHLIDNLLVLAMIYLKNCRVDVKQQSLTLLEYIIIGFCAIEEFCNLLQFCVLDTLPFYIFRIKMKIILGLAIICISFHSIVCPPVSPQPVEGGSKEDDQVHTFLYTCSVSLQCSQFLLLK